jgi:hypothetical protein
MVISIHGVSSLELDVGTPGVPELPGLFDSIATAGAAKARLAIPVATVVAARRVILVLVIVDPLFLGELMVVMTCRESPRKGRRHIGRAPSDSRPNPSDGG